MKLVQPHSREEQQLVHRVLVLAGILLLLDQATKIVAEQTLYGQDAINVIPGCFDLIYVTNKGAAWGMLSNLPGGRWLLLAISAVVTAVVVWRFRTLTEGRSERFYAFGMILGGIFGNGIDRAWRGAVVDFLDFYWGRWHWPAFNVADSAICVGVAIFALSTLFFSGHQEQPSPAPATGGEDHDDQPPAEPPAGR